MRYYKTEQYDLPNEEWRDLPNYPTTKGLYWVSNFGRYKSKLKNGKFYYSFGSGIEGDYKYLTIYHNKVRISRVSMHDLVAQAFIGPVDYSTEIVHHISQIRDQNNVQNLIILKESEHIKYHRPHLGKKHTKQTKLKMSKTHKNNHTAKDLVTGRFVANNADQNK